MSKSVADALIFLKSTEPEFCDIDLTAEFIVYINNVFDILNRRSKFSNKPICTETINSYKEFTYNFTTYIKGLEFVEYKKNGQSCISKVLQSNRKTGFM